MPDKKFELHSITVEDENGVVATIDLDAATVTPAGAEPSELDPTVIANFLLRLGVFIGGGELALKELWNK